MNKDPAIPSSSEETNLDDEDIETQKNPITPLMVNEKLGILVQDRQQSVYRTLLCQICHEIYNNPRFLFCHHSFCTSCIENIANAAPSTITPLDNSIAVDESSSGLTLEDDSLESPTQAIPVQISAPNPLAKLPSGKDPSKQPSNPLSSNPNVFHDDYLLPNTSFNLKIICPTCSHITPLPDIASISKLTKNCAIINIVNLLNSSPSLQQFAGFPKNEEPVIPEQEKTIPKCQNCDVEDALVFCHQCKVNMCPSCADVTHKAAIFQNHNLISIDESQNINDNSDPNKIYLPCQIHKDGFLKFFCVSCEDFVCRDCIQIGGHLDHIYITVENASLNADFKLLKFQKYARACFPGIVKRQLEASHAKQMLEESKTTAFADIDKFFDLVSNTISERKVALLRELETSSSKTLEKLINYNANITQAVSGLQTLMQLGAKVLTEGSEMDKIRIAMKIIPLSKELQLKRSREKKRIKHLSNYDLKPGQILSSDDEDLEDSENDEEELGQPPAPQISEEKVDPFNRKITPPQSTTKALNIGKLLGPKPTFLRESKVSVLFPEPTDFVAGVAELGSVYSSVGYSSFGLVSPVTKEQLIAAKSKSITVTTLPTGYHDVHDGGCCFDSRRRLIFSVYGNENKGKILHILNVKTRTTSKVDLPHSTHGSYPVFDGIRYVYLPEDDDSSSTPCALSRYDIVSSKLERLPNCPYHFVRYSRAVVSGGKLFHCERGGHLVIFDPVKKQWSKGPLYPNKRAHLFSPHPYSNKPYFYTFCGNKTIHKYDIINKTFSLVTNINSWSSSLGANASAIVIPCRETISTPEKTPYFFICDPSHFFDPVAKTWSDPFSCGRMPMKNDGGHCFWDDVSGSIVSHRGNSWGYLQVITSKPPFVAK